MDENRELREDLSKLEALLNRKIEQQETKVKRLKRDCRTDTGPDALRLFWAEQELEEFKLFLKIANGVNKLVDRLDITY